MPEIEKGSVDQILVPLDVVAVPSLLQIEDITSVQFSFKRPGDLPAEEDWRAGAFDPPYAICLLDGTLDTGTWVVRVRVNDQPGRPIVRAGTIDVSNGY